MKHYEWEQGIIFICSDHYILIIISVFLSNLKLYLALHFMQYILLRYLCCNIFGTFIQHLPFKICNWNLHSKISFILPFLPIQIPITFQQPHSNQNNIIVVEMQMVSIVKYSTWIMEQCNFLATEALSLAKDKLVPVGKNSSFIQKSSSRILGFSGMKYIEWECCQNHFPCNRGSLFRWYYSIITEIVTIT